jgi:protein tyrosine phosphatase
MEFRILTRVCTTFAHFIKLFRPPESNFRAQNRYFDILPYEYNAVKSTNLEGESVYANGSYIDIPIQNKGEKAFIAAQAPLKRTVENWWHMLISNKVKLIVMLCNFLENKLPACEEYWSETTNMTFGKIEVQTDSYEEHNENLKSFSITATRGEEKHELTLL